MRGIQVRKVLKPYKIIRTARTKERSWIIEENDSFNDS